MKFKPLPILDFFRRALAKVNDRKYLQTLPMLPDKSDLFLVEFPKSGITWLTFLIANTNLKLSKDGRIATFASVKDLVPDIHEGRFLGPSQTTHPHFRCIKSHAPYNPYYNKVVYLVRDPHNVMVSYHTFLTQLGLFQDSLEQMLDHPSFGIQSWCDHVEGWLSQTTPSKMFILLRYEDLLKDPGQKVKQLYRLFGYDLGPDMIESIVEKSSIEIMRHEEELYFKDHPGVGNLVFVRKGPPGGARTPLSNEAKAKIKKIAGPLMEKLGYL